MKRLLLLALLIIGIGVSITTLAAPGVLADARGEVCGGIGAVSGTGDCTATDGLSVPGLLKTVINILSVIIGAVAVIMIIYAGFVYVTSGGDSSKIGTAKNTLIYAIVGIIVVAFSQALVQFVLSKV